jgi:aldehyde:ferredoxin oxidoreductase
MAIGGFADRVAWVDLTSGDIEYRKIDESDARKYIGARGLGVKYVFDNGPEVEPFSPDNLLCIMNGPLTGTNVNMSGRLAVVTKSPLSGTVADSHMGGWTAAKLKWAGFDGLVFKGKADKPVYAYVEDGQVTLHDASDLWGKNVHETLAILKQRHGDDCDGMAIGRAGEKLVRFACWLNVNDRAAGRNGTGAVGGSKNLKAIVIKGDKKNRPAPADKDADREARKKALAAIMAPENITSPRKGGLSVYGTNVLMNITESIGALPTKNSQFTAFGAENAEKISGEYVKENILVEDPTCHACPVACKKEIEITEGPFAGLRMESVEYEPAWSLGANCGNSDVASVAKMIDQCNDYGMDPIELGNVLSMFMETSGLGATNGDALQWGDYMAMVAMTDRIGDRDGVGDILAEGTERAAKHFGHGELAMTCKGQAIPAYDPRGMKGMGVAYATSNRGGCHLRAYDAAAELGVMPFGSLKVDPLAWKGKGELTRVFQDIHAVSDSFDICKFSAFAQGMQEYTEQYNAVTGFNVSIEELMMCGERIYNLERYYNNLAGFGAGSDTLPLRFTTEPSTMPGSEGHVCELDQMLEEYYASRGWNNGVVPEEKLVALEII